MVPYMTPVAMRSAVPRSSRYGVFLRFHALACNRFAGVRPFRFTFLQRPRLPDPATLSRLRLFPSEPDLKSSMSQTVST